MTELKVILHRWFPDSALHHQLKLSCWLAVAVGAIAFTIGFIHEWDAGAGLILVLIGIPGAAIIALVGGLALLATAVRHYRDFSTFPQRLVALLLGPLVALTAVLTFLPLTWTGAWLGDLSRLALNHADYEAIIADAQRNRKSAWYAESRGITYSVDLGPPVRVAFNPAGILDNWSGIIYDPSGEVMLADGFDEQGRFTAPDRITKIFDGDLVRCRHLWGDYYTCSFT